VRVHLADDLDSPGALAAVDAWADEALRRPSSGVADAGSRVAEAVDALLGVALH
jgi:L-cysteine:1D-myo-inositol 2-amino-2-deoxy-alpha-D-glucopyranoside ligase